MNIEILYILFPAFVLLHELEELFTQKRWMERNADSIIVRFPLLSNIVHMLKGTSTKKFALIILEEIIIASACTVSFIYGAQWPLYALFWGFSVHLLAHIVLAVPLQSYYVPGLVSGIFLIPYATFGLMNLTIRFSTAENIGWALGGTAFVVLNLWLVRRIGK